MKILYFDATKKGISVASTLLLQSATVITVIIAVWMTADFITRVQGGGCGCVAQGHSQSCSHVTPALACLCAEGHSSIKRTQSEVLCAPNHVFLGLFLLLRTPSGLSCVFHWGECFHVVDDGCHAIFFPISTQDVWSLARVSPLSPLPTVFIDLWNMFPGFCFNVHGKLGLS